MSTTYGYSGSVRTDTRFAASLSGDQTGTLNAATSNTINFSPAGGDAPTLSGFLHGTVTCAAGDWLLAHATDPFQSMGDAAYSAGFTVAGSKLKYLEIKNLDATRSVTIARATTNGLPIFDAADDAITIPPGGVFILLLPAGTSALTTGSNDALTISVSGGSPQLSVYAAYGP